MFSFKELQNFLLFFLIWWSYHHKVFKSLYLFYNSFSTNFQCLQSWFRNDYKLFWNIRGSMLKFSLFWEVKLNCFLNCSIWFESKLLAINILSLPKRQASIWYLRKQGNLFFLLWHISHYNFALIRMIYDHVLDFLFIIRSYKRLISLGDHHVIFQVALPLLYFFFKNNWIGSYRDSNSSLLIT